VSQPDVRLLDWAARATGAPVLSARTLRGEWGPWLLDLGDREVVLKVAPDGDPAFLASEAAAMTLAASYGLPTPSLIAHDPLALIRSVLPGTTSVPVELTATRLRALGAAAAAFHRVPLTPTPELPMRERHMYWKDLAAWRREGAEPSTPLLDEAGRVLQRQPVPDDELVFVHGDLWAGNTLWLGDECVGVIDWDAAGAGSYGVDLGSLRLDTALFYGVGAIDEVLAGWEDASGRAAENVAYWDVVAALNVEADMKDSVPAMQSTGRVDLDGATLNRRRDEFVADALARLR